MAWTTPGTAVAGSVYTAAFYNEQTRDNLNYLKAEADAVGLVHLDTTSFSAVVSVSINDVFSSEYDAYRIVVAGTQSAANTLGLRMRASGSDDATSSAYERQLLQASDSSVTALRIQANLFGVGFLSSSLQSIVVCDLFGPALAQATSFVSTSSYRESGTNTLGCRIDGAMHILTTAYDGFTLLRSSTNTITGTVSTYGYRKV